MNPMHRPAFTPISLPMLLGRIAHEWETRNRILDLPTGRFYQADPAHDLSVSLGGRAAATPVGPAAGPHTQLAGNFVLAWLAGARVFECKTVQVLDELEIERPCIDMEAEGYNVEWSQELTLDQSLEEYAKAWIVLDVLRRWRELWPVVGRVPGPHLFDLSVGYDLAGIRSHAVDTFIRGMIDASDVLEPLVRTIPEPFAMMRDHAFDPRLATTATLSTFHGCPPEEIEAIARHLMDEYGLDVVVKLNPTLLGFETVGGILHDRLGYREVPLDESAFEADLAFERAVSMIPDLARYAADRGRRFGIKLTNTLVVGNHRRRLPGELAYLSGPPLHVISMTLLDRLVDALPGVLDVGPDGGDVQVSWSAGVDMANFPETVGLGLRPVTVCSDLLKPGGYGHLATMLKKLNQEMTSSAVTDVAGWVAHRHEDAVAAGHRDAVAAHVAELGTEHGVRRYTVDRVRSRLREVDHDLELWGCVACNVCVTVCPNDAMLHLRTPDAFGEHSDDKWQYLCLAELCNECGNCTTFCPETGAPWLVKPRLFFDEGRFAADPEGRPAFLVEAAGDGFRVTPSEGLEDEVAPLEELLSGPEGLPFRPEDLAALT
jgi:putative selenate reductase